MKNTLLIITGLALILTLAVSCEDNNPDSSVPAINVKWYPNPNGDSELALLMRSMFEEALYIKQQVEKGQPARIRVDHEKILTAHATEPEKAASPEYKAFAQTYLMTIEHLRNATPEDLPDLYDNLVASCSTCHQALCPGPLARIRQLR